MGHGIEAYFAERVRFARRVSSMTVAVSAAFLALFALGRLSPIARALRDVPILRFGYEGPEQYVRHIELISRTGLSAKTHGLEARYVPPARRGGSAPNRRRDPRGAPETRAPRDVEGDAEVDRLARAMARAENVPLVQSRDLIIEELVRPIYPEPARERGIEGKVTVLALVDTSGRVARVEVVGRSEERLLERAAEEAVWKCRFRPYQSEGKKQTVYAMFRFSFRIY